MLHVGVTGGIGSGKSTVCRILEVFAVPVFNADLEAKRLVSEDPELRAELIGSFGSWVFVGGVLDRKALADVVFHDEAALGRLNDIVHPRVRALFTKWAAEATAPYVVMEAAIMIKTGGSKLMDHVVVVTAPMDLRIARVMARDGSARSSVEARMKNQLNDDEMVAGANTVILNDDQHLVIPQVLALHHNMLQQAQA
ncbi:MAG: dephospho-CoA kinase [Flavobacteriales bacterium]|nr:dephospho-CoA kinase [Flavobacteriales bacterium]